MKDRNMIGFCQEYYSLQNADGHDLVIDGPNFFLTEDIAAEMAGRICVEYRDTVVIRRHVDTIVRVFNAVTTATEVTDTADVAS